MKRTRFGWWLSGATVLALAACGGSSDDGSNVLGDNDAVADKDHIRFALEVDKLDLGSMDAKSKGLPRKKYTVAAPWKFSPDKVGRLSILFVIDLSGSMDDNDPLVSDDCERHKAVLALVKDLKDKLKPGDEVSVGAVGFSAEAQVLSPFVPLADFEKAATAKTFCQMLENTDYEKAFKLAATTVGDLKPIDGVTAPIAAYFVTDGLPTSTRQASVDAAGELRKALTAKHKDSTLSAVFLGVKGGLTGSIFLPPTATAAGGGGSAAGGGTPNVGSGTGNSGSPAPAPTYGLTAGDELDDVSKQALELLGEITGDPKRVKGVADVASLGSELTKFERPKPGLDDGSVKIKLDDGKNPKEFLCKDDAAACKIEKVPDPNEVSWTVTVTFPLVGAEGKEVPNVVDISGKLVDGQAIHAKATVMFKSIR